MSADVPLLPETVVFQVLPVGAFVEKREGRYRRARKFKSKCANQKGQFEARSLNYLHSLIIGNATSQDVHRINRKHTIYR